MPKVRVTLPVFGCREYIWKCIDSMQNHTISEIDFMIDCTPYDSVDIIKHYMEHELQINIINHERNISSMMAHYNGCFAANGECLT